KSLREQLRAAQRRGVEVTPFDHRDLEPFVELVARTYQHKHGVLPPPAALIRAIWNRGRETALLALAARKGRTLLSGLWLIVSSQEAYAFLQGTAPEAYPLRASALLFDRAIALARERGCAWFSFGATPSASKGVRFFKESFGAVPHTYPLYVVQHPVYRGLRSLYKGAQALRGKREIQP
ncbi:MAG: GNAT family N-acetyltransferase, partial [Candidatus Hydrothermae bacterium]|nr:GNAT family N-acetyltransferase [Candidatus Hydrothermae bacterium]